MSRKTFLLLAVFAAVLSVHGFALAESTERVSVDSSGNQGNNSSFTPSISADGRYVVFQSGASNLVLNDTNGNLDTFVHDRQTGTTERVSVDSTGNQANESSSYGYISANGRYVAFDSYASNLVPGDTNGTYDAFIHDRQTGVTEILNVDGAGNLGNGGSTVTTGCGAPPTISADGRYMVFMSGSSNLVPGDTNGTGDIFVHDRQTGTTERVSVDSAGNQANGRSYGPTISLDGQYVAFFSYASNLVPNDTNGRTDVFVHDRQTGVTERVSVDSAGNQADGDSYSVNSISSNGQHVAFDSYASNLVPDDTNVTGDAFVHDRLTGVTEIVSVDSAGNIGNGQSQCSFVSADGRYVAFESSASNLVLGDTNGSRDAFVHDRLTGVTEIASVDGAGNLGNGGSWTPYLSSDGRYVAFDSNSSNLVPGDNNGTYDAFVHDRERDYDSDGYSNYVGGDCNDYVDTIYPGAVEVKHDGIDQDCNGYDLTIDITDATYRVNQDKLTVQATSSLGATANLTLVGYGPMSYVGNSWKITVQPAGGDPGTVTVSGVEGSESATTTVK